MGMYEAGGQIAKGMRDLLLKWDETRLYWNDVNSEAMQRDFLEPMEGNMKAALSAMEQMGIILQQIRRDCE